AVRVFQLMPSTAKRLGVNPYYLSDNIKGGLMYYKRLYNMFGSTELALAAYNAGPGAVKRYKKVPPIGETRSFVSKIMKEYNRQKINPDPAILKVKNMKQDIKQVELKQLEEKKPEVKAVEVKEIETTNVQTQEPLPSQGVV
ncbi:MAG TPA: lytic transglycosylase domain-containing protein, partial [Candidatus Gastranaerophilaceae bacterium]|nr:lytic transglycosylase domain-containing protein [Candidatus Gastranaerophilaceae bacterium]